jgi:hypothetical protein
MHLMALFRRKQAEAPVASASSTPTPAWNDPPLTEEILDGLQEPLPPGDLEWNRPTRCPKCEDWGYIDRLDLVDRMMMLHCPTCYFHWEISEAQIDAVNAKRERDQARSF